MSEALGERLAELEKEVEALAGRRFNLGSNAQVSGCGTGKASPADWWPPTCISTCLPALLPCLYSTSACLPCLAWLTLQVRELLFDWLGIQKPPCATVGNGVSTKVSEPRCPAFLQCVPGHQLPPHRPCVPPSHACTQREVLDALMERDGCHPMVPLIIEHRKARILSCCSPAQPASAAAAGIAAGL